MGRVVFSAQSPGDPRLVTLRARDLLAAADVVVADRTAYPELLGHAPARARVELVPVDRAASDIAEQLVAHAGAHPLVVRLVGSTPRCTSALFHEARHVAAAGVEIEIVPWVGADVLLATHAAVAAQPCGASPLSVVFGASPSDGEPGWLRVAVEGSPLVVTTSSDALALLSERLIAAGMPKEREALVTRALAETGQATIATTIGTLGALGSEADALVVVTLGSELAVDPRLSWRRRQRLRGARVLVTRTREQAASTVECLREEGAEVLVVPVIELRPPQDRAPLMRAAAEVGRYDWLVFTSANGVESFFDALASSGLDSRALGRARVAVIGPATARSVAGHGVRADLVAREHVGEGLAEDLLAAFGRERPRVLLPRAAKARDVVPEALRAAGCEVDVVAAYETHPPPPEVMEALSAMLRAGAVDAVTFTSSSTVHHLVEALGADAARTLAGVVVASIGPVTTDAARARGLDVAVTASRFTAEGLVDALATYWAIAPRD